MAVGKRRIDYNREILEALEKSKGLERRSLSQTIYDLGLHNVPEAILPGREDCFDSDLEAVREYIENFQDQRFFQALINIGAVIDTSYLFFEESKETYQKLNEHDN